MNNKIRYKEKFWKVLKSLILTRLGHSEQKIRVWDFEKEIVLEWKTNAFENSEIAKIECS